MWHNAVVDWVDDRTGVESKMYMVRVKYAIDGKADEYIGVHTTRI